MEVHEGNPGTKVNIKDLFAGKKGVLFAVPGAFTPGCSKVNSESRSSTNMSTAARRFKLQCMHAVYLLVSVRLSQMCF